MPTIDQPISVQTLITIQGVECNTIIHGATAEEVHTHLAGLLGGPEGEVAGKSPAAEKSGKGSGKKSQKNTTASTAEEKSAPVQDAAPAEEAQQEEPANPTPAESEPTTAAPPTPAETDTAPEATATPSATETATQPKVTKAELLAKAKELIGTGEAGVATLGEILAKYDATRVSTVSDDHVAKVYADLDAAVRAS